MSIQVRWMIKRDMPEVMQIENQSFEFKWTEKEFLSQLRRRNVEGIVAEINHRIVGFIVCEFNRPDIQVMNLAVCKHYRRIGVASKLIQRTKIRMREHSRNIIIVGVRERNLPAQLFFQSCGFKSTEIIRKPYECCDDDEYKMEYEVKSECFEVA